MKKQKAKSNGKHPGGRPPEDPKEKVDFQQVYRLAELGATGPEIAFVLGIAEKTLYRWLKRSKEFKSVLKKARMTADYQVLAGAKKRATGYEWVETTSEKRKFRDGTSSEFTRSVTKHVPAEPTAFIWWMNNRDRIRWPARTSNELPPPEGFRGIIFVPVRVGGKKNVDPLALPPQNGDGAEA